MDQIQMHLLVTVWKRGFLDLGSEHEAGAWKHVTEALTIVAQDSHCVLLTNAAFAYMLVLLVLPCLRLSQAARSLLLRWWLKLVLLLLGGACCPWRFCRDPSLQIHHHWDAAFLLLLRDAADRLEQVFLLFVDHPVTIPSGHDFGGGRDFVAATWRLNLRHV